MVEHFEDSELLFHRVKNVTLDGRNVPPTEIGYPGSNGMSVNRERFSLPEDVLWPDCSTWGIAALSCADIRSVMEESGDGRRRFTLAPRHDPLEASMELDQRENYAHSLIITLEDGRHDHTPPTNSVKKKIRFEIARFLRVLKRPT
ncbi:MAG: hypothetical protein HC923_06945 [Myxococcales bacterium]|nr:hypothetical protein [Myxococcales bacterium]